MTNERLAKALSWTIVAAILACTAALLAGIEVLARRPPQWPIGLLDRQAPTKSSHCAPSASSTAGRRNHPRPRMTIRPMARSRTGTRSRCT